MRNRSPQKLIAIAVATQTATSVYTKIVPLIFVGACLSILVGAALGISWGYAAGLVGQRAFSVTNETSGVDSGQTGEMIVKFKSRQVVDQIKQNKIKNKELKALFEKYDIRGEQALTNLKNLDRSATAIGLDRIMKLSSPAFYDNKKNTLNWEKRANLDDTAISSRMKSALTDILALSDLVEYAEPSPDKVLDVSISDPYYSATNPDTQWGLPRIGLTAGSNSSVASGWDVTTGKKEIIVMVFDTGINAKHPDLAGNMWINSSEDINKDGKIDESDRNGIDDDKDGFVDNFYGSSGKSGTDDNGHGTHIAGIIGAVTNNNQGIAGVCPNCRLMDGKDDSGSLTEFLNDVLFGVARGVKVVNLSASYNGGRNTLIDIESYLYANNVVFVVSSGNYGDLLTTYPQVLDKGIVAGNINSSNVRRASSSYGAGVDIVAPGTKIISTAAASGLGACKQNGYVTNDYCYMTGTSMAAPHVAGAVSLLLSNNPAFRVEEIKQILRSSAVDLGNSGWDKEYSYGLLNIPQALAVKTVLTPHLSFPENNSLQTNVFDIKGFVNGKDIKSVVLEYGYGLEPIVWDPLLAADSPITADSVLAVGVDPTNQPTNFLTFRWSATSTDGRVFSDRKMIFTGNNLIKTPAGSDTNQFKTTDVVDVYGTSKGEGWQSYKLFYRHDEGEWLTKGVISANNGQSAVIGNFLGRIDLPKSDIAKCFNNKNICVVDLKLVTNYAGRTEDSILRKAFSVVNTGASNTPAPTNGNLQHDSEEAGSNASGEGVANESGLMDKVMNFFKGLFQE